MEYIKLSDCAYYSNDRTKDINLDTYITTDNMLPNKSGITIAETLPNVKSTGAYHPNDILLSNIRPYFRKIWFADRNGSCSNDVLVVRSKENVVPKFLYYVLSDNNFFNYDYVTSKGTKMPRGTPKAIMKYLVPDISKEDQKKIANMLSNYDLLIENNNKRIKLLEQTAQEIYKEWFVRFRFPGHEKVKFVNGLPAEWTGKRVNALLTLQSGHAFKSEDYSGTGQYKVVTIKNVQDNGFEGNSTDRIDFIPSKMPKHCVLKEGDLLLSLTGNVGRICVVYGDNYLLNQRVAKIKTDYPNYAYCMFKNDSMLSSLINLANGTAQQNLSPVKTENMRTIIPDNMILKKFEGIVKPLLDKTLVLKKENDVLIKQRDYLLPRLMSGKLEV